MDTTSVSLLNQLRQPDQEEAWIQFVHLYSPLIYNCGIKLGLNATDSGEMVQEVFLVLIKHLPEFNYNPEKSFRKWLQTIAKNKAIDLIRRNSARPVNGILDEESLSVPSEIDLFEETQYRNYLVNRCRVLIEKEFEPNTWLACWNYVSNEHSAEAIGHELGISANAVRVAKFRVLRRLREVLDGFLD
ncbi:MAG: sigma-70 family RNA polymerase sigma factor [Pirellulales bacterium]